jgi:hypothetical protein
VMRENGQIEAETVVSIFPHLIEMPRLDGVRHFWRKRRVGLKDCSLSKQCCLSKL